MSAKELTAAQVNEVRERLEAIASEQEPSITRFDEDRYVVPGEHAYYSIVVDEDGILVEKRRTVLNTTDFRDLRRWLHQRGIEI